MAGASCDDIFVIVLFYSFKNLVATSTFDAWSVGQIPISIVSGVILGIGVGFLMVLAIRYMKLNRIAHVVSMLGLSFGMLALENALKPYFSVSSLLAIIVMAFVVGIFKKERSLGVLCSVIATNFTWKEKLYIVLSYLPKATVQASIGAIALSEGLACGTLVLTAAVVAILITAPLGAILMDSLKNKLLMKER